MPVDLKELVAPGSCAIVCMEMQRGVVGDLTSLPAIADEIKASGMPSRLAALLDAARAAGVPVVYCTAVFRADRKGSAAVTPLSLRLARNPGHMVEGTPSAEVIPELTPRPEDLVCARSHGMSPFTGTALDAMLRNLGVKTVIATGVSVNIGITGTVIEAVGLGYRAVIPRDCVAGSPPEYAEAVLKNTLALLATITTSEAIAAAWQGG